MSRAAFALDSSRDFRVERLRTRRPNAEISFRLPVPPGGGTAYQDWRIEAVRNMKRQGMRSFGGIVRVDVELPQDRAHGVENCLRAVFDVLEVAGVVQTAAAIDDYRAKRSEAAELVIRVKAA